MMMTEPRGSGSLVVFISLNLKVEVLDALVAHMYSVQSICIRDGGEK